MKKVEDTQEQPELSQEELQERREKLTAFYKSNLEHLKVQKEYETLLTDIEEARYKRTQMQISMSQMLKNFEEVEKNQDGTA